MKNRTSKKYIDWPSAYLFLSGVLLAVKIKVVGEIYGSDIALALAIPVSFVALPPAPLTRAIRYTMFFLGAWFASAVLTDVYRQTPVEDFSRGWAKIGLFGVCLFSVVQLSGLKLQRLVTFGVGIAIGSLVRALIAPDSYQLIAPWKFGYGGPLIALAFAYLSREKAKIPNWLLIAVPLAFTVASFVQDSRSLAGVALAAGGFSLLARMRTDTLRKPLSVATLAPYMIAAVLVAGGLLQGYSYAAKSGWLGQDAAAKYAVQSAAGLGVVLGGRTESLVSTQAISDSPFIGHGSWAKDTYYVAERVLLLRERGVKERGDWNKTALIPSHSYLLGSWVEHGVAGGLFWACAFVVTCGGLISLLEVRIPQTPAISYSLLNFAWAIFFSPFGADVRVSAAAFLCMAFSALNASLQTPTASGITPGHRFVTFRKRQPALARASSSKI